MAAAAWLGLPSTVRGTPTLTHILADCQCTCRGVAHVACTALVLRRHNDTPFLLCTSLAGELLGNPAACSEHGGTCGSGSDGGSSGASSSGGSLSSVPSCSSAPTSRTASWTALGACGPATPTCTPACRRHVSPAAAHAPAEAAEAALSPSCGRLQHLECCGVAEEPAEGGGGSCAGGHAVAAERVPAVDVYGSSAGIGRRDGVRC